MKLSSWFFLITAQDRATENFSSVALYRGLYGLTPVRLIGGGLLARADADMVVMAKLRQAFVTYFILPVAMLGLFSIPGPVTAG